MVDPGRQPPIRESAGRCEKLGGPPSSQDASAFTKRTGLAAVRTRRNVLALGTASVIGGLVAGGLAWRMVRLAEPNEAASLGLSPQNSGIENREKLVSALSYSDLSVRFAPGDYLIDNSTDQPERGLDDDGYVTVNEFSGFIEMDEGARLIFTDGTRRGLIFSGGTGAMLRGVSTAFRDGPPPERIIAEENITFSNAVRPDIEDITIDGSAAAGLLFYECVEPRVVRATITNTTADGLNFSNCWDAEASDIRTDNTGDDGLAFVNYSSGVEATGGRAYNIVVSNSRARGIAVAGQSDVVIDGFDVRDTSVSGLICAWDEFYDTRVPENVVFRNGSVIRAGHFSGQTGNRFGIEIDAARSAVFENVTVEASIGYGVSSVASRVVKGEDVLGEITLANIDVRDIEDSAGFFLLGEEGEYADAPRGRYTLTDLTASNLGGGGIFVLGSESVSLRHVTVRDVSRVDPAAVAFGIEWNVNVDGSGLRIVDGKSEPTGYRITLNGEQFGGLGEISDEVEGRPVEVEGDTDLSYEIRDALA